MLVTQAMIASVLPVTSIGPRAPGSDLVRLTESAGMLLASSTSGRNALEEVNGEVATFLPAMSV